MYDRFLIDDIDEIDLPIPITNTDELFCSFYMMTFDKEKHPYGYKIRT